jgi:type III secretory pathway lipoprotein EscJ
MTSMVQVAIAGDATEAEEIQAILTEAGIESQLEPEDEADAIAVLVPDSKVDLAQDAIEAMTEPDELDTRA